MDLLVNNQSALAFKPHSFGLLALGIRVNALPMHFASLPHALILATVRPLESSVSMSNIVLVLSLVSGAVWPLINTLSVHVPVVPVAFVGAPVSPGIVASPSLFIVVPLAEVSGPIWPQVLSIPIFLAVLVLAFIDGAVLPPLLALPMVHIVAPLANVGLGARGETAVAAALVIEPLALVGVPIL